MSVRAPGHETAATSVGIDVGGTFTDVVALRPDGSVVTSKVLSTPRDQSAAVVRALEAVGDAAAHADRLVHGTTLVTNLLLERAGARVALCATEGATDLLTLRRQDRASLYDLAAQHPPPLVEDASIVAVPERLSVRGACRPLTDADADAVAARVVALRPEVVAVSLLHSYADPSAERALGAALRRALPGIEIVLSSDVLPEIREYERTATTVAEAYARPAVAAYLRGLAGRTRALGVPEPGVMTSSGGTRSAEDASRHAASLALSGPAGGVVGAAHVARDAGIERALTIDIGGTSADAGLILDGEALVEAGGSVAGVPIALPRVLVETVSAGGGSIGWIDDGGALRVGPRSAGALPGPAAFGTGGTEPTVTDAHVVLGHIRDARFGAGVTIDVGAATRAVAALAARLGASLERTAAAMIAGADAAMARALRRVSVERGIDPRGCTLIAFGGGGPLHGCTLAEHVGIGRVFVPPVAGVLSALGLALAAERRESIASVMRPAAELSREHLGEIVAALDATAIASSSGDTRRAGAGASAFARATWVRARYTGQGHELEVPIGPADAGAEITRRFARAHEMRFGFVLDAPVVVISARHTVSGEARTARLRRHGPSTWSVQRPIDSGGELDATVVGPASITLPDATLLVREGWRARALPAGGWMLERTA